MNHFPSAAFRSFNDAYLGSLAGVKGFGCDVGGVSDSTSVGSLFGELPRGFREMMAHSYTIENPRARFVHVPVRKFNLNFGIAQTVWFFSGSDALEPIAFYNQRGRQFSDDGVTLHGAYGKRLFGRSDGTSQMETVIEEVSRGHDVTAQILLPSDLEVETKDFPCTTAFTFMPRAEQLHMFCSMRSQSAAMVMPYDVFSATLIQELVASATGRGLGRYYHCSNSFHYYHDESKIVDEIIEAAPVESSVMPAMPMNTSLEDLRPIVAFEADMREAVLADALDVGEALSRAQALGSYWEQYARILLMRAVSEDSRSLVLDGMNSVYAEFF